MTTQIKDFPPEKLGFDGKVPFSNAAGETKLTESVSIEELNMHTGIRTGGEITINGGDNTKYDVAAGTAIIVNRDDPENPIVKRITFAADIGRSVEPGHVTFVYVNEFGVLEQSALIPSPLDVKERPFVGQLIHLTATSQILYSLKNPIVAHGTSQTEINALVLANGASRVSGCLIEPASTDLSLKISAGQVKQYGRNFHIDPGNPNFRDTPATDPVLASEFFKSTTNPIDGLILITPGVKTDQLDPTLFNADGLLAGGETDGLTAVSPSNRFTVIRVFLSANSNALILYYGTKQYVTAQEGLSAAEPNFKEAVETFSTSPIAKIAIRGDVTDLAAGIIAGNVVIMQISERIQLG